MTGRPMTDAQLTAALRAHLPAHAQADLRDRIRAEVARTGQSRRLPWLLGVGGADPMARRRALLVVALLALLAAASVAVAVGAWIRSQDHDVDLTRPTEVDRFVAASYDGFARLSAFRLVLAEEGSLDYVYLFDGRVLREEYGDSISLSGPDFGAHNDVLQGRPVWVVSPDNAHPLWRLAGAIFGGADCATGWELVELVDVIGRPTRHVRCTVRDIAGGTTAYGQTGPQVHELHLWIDISTGIPLRRGSREFSVYDSQGGGPNYSGLHVIDVTELAFGPQDPELFALTGETVSQEEFACATEGVCASPGPPSSQAPTTPLETPPPALISAGDPGDLSAYVASVFRTYESVGPVDVVFDPAPADQSFLRVRADGLGNFRRELAAFPDRVGWLTTGGRSYESYGEPDGVTWRDWGAASPMLLTIWLTMELPRGCGIGWSYLGDDLVLGRPAAHLSCGFREFWIDRDWLLVTRAHNRDPMLGDDANAGLSRVISVSFEPQPAELFAPPPPDSIWFFQ